MSIQSIFCSIILVGTFDSRQSLTFRLISGIILEDAVFGAVRVHTVDSCIIQKEASHIAVEICLFLILNKRPEFTAWLAEIKQVNLESLPNWEEKQLFKQYYNLDAYYKRKMEKEARRGVKKVVDDERTVFNDEEQRRQELMREREKHKEEQMQALKREMQSGMAQAMKEQAQLREEMAYQYKLGNFEAAAAIQRRLDPDLPM
ncbi:putative E3 ubiquitin-protein ligase RMA1-like isoform 1 [Capsicum annuum]|nr:putative E3 ubiquitin-protein ligase RMA1-like isoform 1 [Capsicum annuum]